MNQKALDLLDSKQKLIGASIKMASNEHCVRARENKTPCRKKIVVHPLRMGPKCEIRDP